ncbi:hypothetical protein PR003_g33526 [Phytophthora rubi]|uniref:Uncharacterized protein n=1 Tax=Phytophthora rubi TaxID=129364 RepID=A0A6A4AVS7_9STRA|nr:hypothetical protein PR003_g33526 [Phytophthora rubi]
MIKVAHDDVRHLARRRKGQVYVKLGVLEKDPFETEGVGELVRLAVERGCSKIELGIFGEHGAATPDEDAD